jgi:hypothetical protein
MSVDFRFPLPRLLALPTEAWQGAEIRDIRWKTVKLIYQDPTKFIPKLLYNNASMSQLYKNNLVFVHQFS